MPHGPLGHLYSKDVTKSNYVSPKVCEQDKLLLKDAKTNADFLLKIKLAIFVEKTTVMKLSLDLVCKRDYMLIDICMSLCRLT